MATGTFSNLNDVRRFVERASNGNLLLELPDLQEMKAARQAGRNGVLLREGELSQGRYSGRIELRNGKFIVTITRDSATVRDHAIRTERLLAAAHKESVRRMLRAKFSDDARFIARVTDEPAIVSQFNKPTPAGMKRYVATYHRESAQSNYKIERVIFAKTDASAKKAARGVENGRGFGSMTLLKIERTDRDARTSPFEGKKPDAITQAMLTRAKR